MTFLVVTYAPIIIEKERFLAYAPYVKEMNLWFRHVDRVILLCPQQASPGGQLLLPFNDNVQIEWNPLPNLYFGSIGSAFKSLLQIPRVIAAIFRQMKRADHIHLRCPGNISLLGCLVQVFFPSKPKTAKYAGNWDWAGKQPLSYRFQQIMLRNTFLTKNMQVLVYGSWPDKSSNIVPFYTATYQASDIEEVSLRNLGGRIRLLFVGSLSPGKRPELSVLTCVELIKRGIDVVLDIYGAGPMEEKISQLIIDNNCSHAVVLHGNQPAERIKCAMQEAHFLVFLSQSEGWPKVVAESMFWGCVPISTAVSCVPQMLGNGNRGSVIEADPQVAANAIASYLAAPEQYMLVSNEAMEWSRQFTLDSFEQDIAKILNRDPVSFSL